MGLVVINTILYISLKDIISWLPRTKISVYKDTLAYNIWLSTLLEKMNFFYSMD